jgi:hypothetical protein
MGSRILTICGIAAITALLYVGATTLTGDPAQPLLEGLTDEEMAAEPPPDLPPWPPEDLVWEPVEAAEAPEVRLEVLAESGYVNEHGQYVYDILQSDYGYLGVQFLTPEGRPVRGARPEFEVTGTSRVVAAPTSRDGTSDETGIVEFGVIGGEMGLDRIEITYGEVAMEILLNVISLAAAGFPELEEVDGALRWADLMQARVRYNEQKMTAEFPAEIAEQANRTVRMVGFMMPLEPDLRQRTFLLTSNPPSCFFHVPGGPAGAVEVLAPGGIEMTWDPLILEGRFEPQSVSETGVVYRLRDARLVER